MSVYLVFVSLTLPGVILSRNETTSMYPVSRQRNRIHILVILIVTYRLSPHHRQNEKAALI
jgi:hypothetical protein